MKKVQFEQNSKLNPINEFKLMSSLENCNIIKCHKYFVKNDKLYIMMEYADDGDLDKRVKDARKTLAYLPEKTVSFLRKFDFFFKLLRFYTGSLRFVWP